MASTFNLPSGNDWPVSAQIHSNNGSWQDNHRKTDYQGLSVDELLRQCADTSAGCAWMEFIQRFHPLITTVVRRTCREWPGTPPDVAEDLIQETYLKLCANSSSLLGNFNSRHSNAFLGCIKTVATNVVYDYFRSSRAFKRDVGKNVELDHAINYLHQGDGEAESLDNRILLSEVDRLLQQRGDGPSEEKNRKIFWLYYREGLTAKAIASMSGASMTAKGVEGVIARLTRFVKQSFQAGSLRTSVAAPE